MLLFNAASYNPFFTVLGLLLGAAGLGLAYGGVKLMNSANGSGKVVTILLGVLVLGSGLFVLGLSALCATWVMG